MSIIVLTHHNECIYDITKSFDQSFPKKTKKLEDKTGRCDYKFSRERKRWLLKNGKPHGTMGLPKQPPRNPHDFLKKNTGKPPMLPPEIADPDHGKKPQMQRRLPPVPLREETLKETAEKLKHEKKNHLQKNIKNATTMAPKLPARRVNITITGDSRDLSAGLEPQHLTSKVYGKIPPYLDQLIKVKEKAIQREKDRYTKRPKCAYITREERENLLAGLKQNWEELQRIYQGLPILTDTIPKKQRKSRIESDLKQLEKDIVLIERHPYIYVYDDKNDL
ncbi:PREDICTED: enkurin [Nicrophorus vespilloides]|uniref:Enkurin n=1 Tax=Nicrophorus vespilloides TaxID=110193 RepID=A0ABM1MR19_NICVS|nr:PREDICTED: enkurin [Nicrophorus vespilloides]